MYLQAKRWEHSVGSRDVNKFSGSLDGFHASKGVMVTTSSFTQAAVDYAKGIGKRIVLIDGERLVDLMIEHGVAVSYKAIKLPKVDSDYFEEQ